MVLALRSGLHDEIDWALLRLVVLSHEHGDRFRLHTIPGLTDALFEWPHWFIEQNQPKNTLPTAAIENTLFSTPDDLARKRKHAIESLLALRNVAAYEENVTHLLLHRKVVSLVPALIKLPLTETNNEFVYYGLELLQSFAGAIVLRPPGYTAPVIPVDAIQKIAQTSSDRSMIIASISCLSLLFSNPQNTSFIQLDSPALLRSIQLLPLRNDSMLLTTCLDHIFAHLSYPAASKSFLLHPEMPNMIKVLVNILRMEQKEETKSQAIGPPVKTFVEEKAREDFELSQEQLIALAAKPEPDRAFEWSVIHFNPKSRSFR